MSIFGQDSHAPGPSSMEKGTHLATDARSCRLHHLAPTSPDQPVAWLGQRGEYCEITGRFSCCPVYQKSTHDTGRSLSVLDYPMLPYSYRVVPAYHSCYNGAWHVLLSGSPGPQSGQGTRESSSAPDVKGQRERPCSCHHSEGLANRTCSVARCRRQRTKLDRPSYPSPIGPAYSCVLPRHV